MSTSRLFSVFVALALMVVAVLTVRAGITTSKIVSSGTATLDQQERHPGFVNLSSTVAEQARLEYRRGEWYAGNSYSTLPLDQFDRHPSAATQAYALGALDQFDRHSSPTSPAVFDVEQARIQWRAGQ